MGLSWPDWVLVLVLVISMLGGLLAGAVAQVFAVLGIIVGLWAAMFTSGWVGTHWSGARPALVFETLQWLVAAVIGLLVTTAFQWGGSKLGKAMREGPLGWLDRGGGLVVGASVGVMVCAFVLLAALTLRIPGSPGVAFAKARVTTPTLNAAMELSTWGEAYLPGGSWMKRHFAAAQQRAKQMRAKPVNAKPMNAKPMKKSASKPRSPST